MKKLLLVFGCLACAELQVFPQGTVNFNNANLTPTPLVYYGDPQAGGTPLLETNWAAQLYYGTPGTPESSLISVESPPGRFRATLGAGTWRGGTRTLVGFYNHGQ